MKVLIVEDELELAREITDFLRLERYDCQVSTSLSDAIHLLRDRFFDAIVLDLSLPDGDGMNLLEMIRNDHPDSAVVIASARGALEDRILGLKNGADDYLPKPFSLAELHMRLFAIYRRRLGHTAHPLQVGEFSIDIENRLVYFQDQEIVLFKKEFDILTYLLLNRNRPLSRSQLYEHVWGDLSFPNTDSNYIDVHIKNIRKKMSAFAPVPWLQSVRGIGYKIVMP